MMKDIQTILMNRLIRDCRMCIDLLHEVDLEHADGLITETEQEHRKVQSLIDLIILHENK